MQNAAIGLIEDPSKKNHFLWVKRKDLPIWVLPGGGIDENETPEEAVLREVFEETGLIVSIDRKGAVYSPINKWTAETHIFLCKWVDGIPKITEESSDVGYFDAPPFPSFPLHALWLKETLDNPDVIIKRPLNEFTWTRVGAFFLRHPFILLKYLFASKRAS